MPHDVAEKLVTIAARTRVLDDPALPEGASTRMLIYAATLIAHGMDALAACRIGIIQPLSDDADLCAAVTGNRQWRVRMNAGTAVAASPGIDEGPCAIATREVFPFTRFERTLGLYLRAAWQISTPVQALARSEQTVAARPCPIVTGTALMLPREYEADSPDDSRRFYLACAAHAAAHLTYSTVRFDPARLRPLQLTLVGVIEDAQVERLAIARYPGLRRWWLPFHRTGSESSGTAAALIARLARGLLDPGYVDRDGWVIKGRTLFEAAFSRTAGTTRVLSPSGQLAGQRPRADADPVQREDLHPSRHLS